MNVYLLMVKKSESQTQISENRKRGLGFVRVGFRGIRIELFDGMECVFVCAGRLSEGIDMTFCAKRSLRPCAQSKLEC